MKNSFLILYSFFVTLHSFGCLNEYNVNLRGQVFDEYEGLPIFYRSFDTAYSKQIVNSVDLANKDTIDHETLSDVAVHLTKLRKYKQALSLLQWLGSKYPDEYQIAANLGTLYEINGQVDSAYKHIKKSMDINPESHGGSEWFHLSILKAKMKLKTSPNWLLDNKVLNLGLTDTVEEFSEEQWIILEKIWDIQHQLEERIPFTPDEDLIMANVLIELGELLEIHISIENAYIAYMMASRYDADNLLGAQERIKILLPVFKKYKFEESVFEEHFPEKSMYYPRPFPAKNEKDNSNSYLYVWIGAGIILLIFVLIIIRKRIKTMVGKES